MKKYMISSAAALIFSMASHSVAQTLTTVAGTQGDTSGTSDSVGSASSVAVDSSGNIYVGDQANEVVYKITSGGTKTVFAGTGTQGYNGLSGTATSIQLADAIDLYVDDSDNLYIADSINRLVRKVTPAGTLTTVAGVQGDASGTGNSIGSTTAIAVDSSGNIYVSDVANEVIHRVTSGGVRSVFAGTGTAGYNLASGTATSVQLNNPDDLAIDASGNLIVADTDNRLVRQITPGGALTTIAGVLGDVSGSGDSVGSAHSVAIDTTGNLYVGDLALDVVYLVPTVGSKSVFIGTGTAGYNGLTGTATSIQLDQPMDLFFESSGGGVFVADMNNRLVRRVDAVLPVELDFFAVE